MPFPIAPYEVCSFCQDLSGDREYAFIIQNEAAAAELAEQRAIAGEIRRALSSPLPEP